MLQPIGYAPCACRDCCELTLSAGTMCHECDDAGCDPHRECLAAGAYGGEDEPPPAPHSDPAVELPRLLAALLALDAAAYARVAPPVARIPAAACADRNHPYWSTAEADAVLGALWLALDAAEQAAR